MAHSSITFSNIRDDLDVPSNTTKLLAERALRNKLAVLELKALLRGLSPHARNPSLYPGKQALKAFTHH